MLAPESVISVMAMEFPERLARLRKDRGPSQRALGEMVGVHVSHLRRYEAGKPQPTLEVLRKLARALPVSADVLLFNDGERDREKEFRYRFEAVSKLDKEQRKVIKAVLDAILLPHDAKRWAAE